MGSGEAAYAFAVVAEAKADQRIASELAERVMVGEVDWIGEESLGGLFRWQGLQASSEYLPWRSVTGAARARGIVTHGKFRQSPGVFDERRARTALRLFKALDERPTAVLLVRDTDGEAGRVESLERVRTTGEWEFEVILATPDPKRECWVLAGNLLAEGRSRHAERTRNAIAAGRFPRRSLNPTGADPGRRRDAVIARRPKT